MPTIFNVKCNRDERIAILKKKEAIAAQLFKSYSIDWEIRLLDYRPSSSTGPKEDF